MRLSFGPFESLARDLRYAFRVLRKSPGFSAIAILSLALGIGANTAVFTLINAIFLRSLPVLHPEELFALRNATPQGTSVTTYPYGFFLELRHRHDLFSGVSCLRQIVPAFSARESLGLVTGECVSGNYFDTLGILPYAGRLLHDGDDTAPGADHVVVLSYSFWKRQFGGNSAVVGTVIRLNATPMTVIGISPPKYESLNVGYAPDVRVPMSMWPLMIGDKSMLASPAKWWPSIVCRLRPGISRIRAEAAVNALFRGYRQQSANTPSRQSRPQRLSLLPASNGLESRAKNAANQLYVLMAIVALVLLAACVNLANLLLARAATRRREIAVRLSLGAGRGHILGQLLTESVLLAGIGGAAGILWAYWGARLLLSFLVVGQIGGVSMRLGPDSHVLIFTAAVSLGTGILFGLAPALQLTRFELAPELKGERSHLSGVGNLWRKALVSAQVALSLLLLIAAGLFLRSLVNLRRVDLGFDSRNVLQVSLDLPDGYNQERAQAFYSHAAERVSHLPGVISASFGASPLQIGNSASGTNVDGAHRNACGAGTRWDSVEPGYFRTFQIPILRGREFQAGDGEHAPHVAIVNDRFARFYFGEQSALGRHFGPDVRQPAADLEIVGVAGDYGSIRGQRACYWYIPYAQQNQIDDLTLFVRTAGDPLKQVRTIQRALWGVDPNVPTYGVKTLNETIDESIATDRMFAIASILFSLLAALLAAVGLYGVMTYSIVKRTPEIGIRMALGAQRSDVIRPVMSEVAATLLVGIAIALSCALALGRLLNAILFEIKPADPLNLLAASAFIAAVALVAGYFPARRAARIDPMIALRYD